MKSELTVEITSVPDREDLVAEVWAGTHQFAEIRRDGDSFVIQVFAPPENSMWEFSFEQLLNSLKQARDRLEGVGMK